MSQVTPPSSWALLLYACAERTSPFYPFSFSRLLLEAEMPPDAGHGKRESAPATISGCHVFPSSNRLAMLLPNRAWQTRPFEDMCAGRKLATASHARMTMTVAGLLSRRQESGAFPLSVAPPFELPRGALRHPLYFPLFLSASPASMPMFPCRHSRRHQWPFSLQGQR